MMDGPMATDGAEKHYLQSEACIRLHDLLAAAAELLNDAQQAFGHNDKLVGCCIAQATELLASAKGEAHREITPSFRRGGLAGWQIRRVKAYIEENLTSTKSVRELAEIAGLSVPHFSRCFKASFGETPSGYITRRRVKRAQLLLQTTQAPLSQIALVCGFADQPHFTRRFRKTVGMAPNTWRRERFPVHGVPR